MNQHPYHTIWISIVLGIILLIVSDRMKPGGHLKKLLMVLLFVAGFFLCLIGVGQAVMTGLNRGFGSQLSYERMMGMEISAEPTVQATALIPQSPAPTAPSRPAQEEPVQKERSTADTQVQLPVRTEPTTLPTQPTLTPPPQEADEQITLPVDKSGRVLELEASLEEERSRHVEALSKAKAELGTMRGENAGLTAEIKSLRGSLEKKSAIEIELATTKQNLVAANAQIAELKAELASTPEPASTQPAPAQVEGDEHPHVKAKKPVATQAPTPEDEEETALAKAQAEAHSGIGWTYGGKKYSAAKSMFPPHLRAPASKLTVEENAERNAMMRKWTVNYLQKGLQIPRQRYDE